MTTFDVDATASPRTYRISGGQERSASPFYVLIALALPLVFVAVAYGSMIVQGLSPRPDGDLPWLWWGLLQALFGTAVMIWVAFSVCWMIGLILTVIAAVAPGYTVWRLDGAGLNSVSGVGPFKRMKSKYVPFEAIAKIQLYKNEVLLHVWRSGVAKYECAIAQAMTEADAKRLADLLTEDLTASAREWEAQGLLINQKAIHHGA